MGPFQSGAYVWIRFRILIVHEQTTGTLSTAKRLEMVHVLYTGQGRTLIDDNKVRRRFKYLDTANNSADIQKLWILATKTRWKWTTTYGEPFMLTYLDIRRKTPTVWW